MKKAEQPSPYETFSFYHGEEVLTCCTPVASGDIMLKPLLLKNNMNCAANYLLNN
jgi:hypothetical protein